MRMPAQAAIGTPRVIRKLWNGPMKEVAKNATQIVPAVRISPSTAAAAGRGIRIPRLISVSPEE